MALVVLELSLVLVAVLIHAHLLHGIDALHGLAADLFYDAADFLITFLFAFIPETRNGVEFLAHGLLDGVAVVLLAMLLYFFFILLPFVAFHGVDVLRMDL